MGFGPCGFIIPPPGFIPGTFFGPLDSGWFGCPTIDDSEDSDDSGDIEERDDNGEFVAGGIGEMGDIGILFRFIFCACIDCICCCGDWFVGTI